jgi:hypothetical protein
MDLASITLHFGVLWIEVYSIFREKFSHLLVYLFGFGHNFPNTVLY